MKNLLLTGALIAAATATAAQAGVLVVPNGTAYVAPATTTYVTPGTTTYVTTPAPGAYYVTYATPQPVYYTAYDYSNDRGYNYNWGYWNHQDRFTRDDHHDWNDSHTD
ncbi:MAG: hypothetical protein WDN72_01895 [Alphaproteobacteria bacterium]